MADEPNKPPTPPAAEPMKPVADLPSPTFSSETIATRIDQWANEKLRGSIVGRDTLVWNYMVDAVRDLKARFGVK